MYSVTNIVRNSTTADPSIGVLILSRWYAMQRIIQKIIPTPNAAGSNRGQAMLTATKKATDQISNRARWLAVF
jgi:hypothetical protein